VSDLHCPMIAVVLDPSGLSIDRVAPKLRAERVTAVVAAAGLSDIAEQWAAALDAVTRPMPAQTVVGSLVELADEFRGETVLALASARKFGAVRGGVALRVAIDGADARAEPWEVPS